MTGRKIARTEIARVLSREERRVIHKAILRDHETVKAFAWRQGLDRGYLSKVLAGKRMLTPEGFNKLFSGLGFRATIGEMKIDLQNDGNSQKESEEISELNSL